MSEVKDIQEEWQPEIKALLKSIKENPLPTHEEAKAIVEGAEIINEGTAHAFPRGCFSLRYKNAITVLNMG